MNHIGIFAFGQSVREIVQTDRSPKVVFVLGVYASAVHAQWINSTGKELIKALAVASEPYIFWCGEDAESIIEAIKIPDGLGKLVPANTMYNGPSGIALDNLILTPLGLVRKEVWLCDLVPYSCMNQPQRKAIEREYLPIAKKIGLPIPTVPTVPSVSAIKKDEIRRKEIVKEMLKSKAEILVLLGDVPISGFLSFFDNRWKRLSDFKTYGHLYDVHLGGRNLKVLPLAHPRQIAGLGLSSDFWLKEHAKWIQQSGQTVSKLLRK